MKTDKCKKINELIPEFGAGRLPGSLRRGVAGHLRECSECASEAAWLEDLRSLAADLDPAIDSALPALRTRIRASAARSVGSAPNHGFSQHLAWSSVALLAAGFLAVFLAFRAPLGPSSADVAREVGDSPPEFTMTLMDEGLVFEWRKNGRTTHKVFRSTTAADFSRARVALVKGPRWVDTDYQAPGTVFFYKVE